MFAAFLSRCSWKCIRGEWTNQSDAGHNAILNEDRTDSKVYNLFLLFFKIINNDFTDHNIIHMYINAFHALYLLCNDIQSNLVNPDPS